MAIDYHSETADLRNSLGDLTDWYKQVEAVSHLFEETFNAGGTVYVAGNGGSATLAQHLSDELVGRYSMHRKAYPVVALTTDGAVLTVIGNDYGYDELFSRQLEALGRPGDVFVGFTTSGASKNIIRAATVAKDKGMKIVCFSGNFGEFKDMADISVVSPAKTTNRIQELDLHAVHLICEHFEPKEMPADRLAYERIEQIINSFKQKRLLIIGDAMIDHYMEGAVDRINPEAPVPVLRVKTHKDMTGGAGNAAKNAASLGAQTTLISVVGKDGNADIYRQTAQSEGYEARLVEDPTRPTIRKERYIAQGQQLLRIDREETHNIESAIEDELIKQIRDTIAGGVDAVIVSDYAKGVITERVATAILEAARQHNVPVAADVKPSRIPYFVGATFISPNLKEAHEYLGLNPQEQGGTSPEKLSEMLQERFKTLVFITMSADGIYVRENADNHYQIPQAHVVEVADPSGAGDTSIVAQTLAYLAGATPKEIALVSNAAGAVVVGKLGSVGITPDELRMMLMHKV